MARLSQAECDVINNATTLPYATQEQFEAQHGLAHAVDIGGLVVYFNEQELIAFYDYELEHGALV